MPDFHKLCVPAQKHTADFLSLLIFFFFSASIGGFLWEVLIFLFKDGTFTNRGFFYGPWLPVYGAGALVLSLFLFKLKKHPVAVFLLSAAIGTLLELAIGCFLDIVFDLRYWDYTGCLLNYRGYVCLWSTLGFGIAGMLWVCFLSTLLSKIWFKIPARIRYVLGTLLVLLFVLDIAAALIFPNTGQGITFP